MVLPSALAVVTREARVTATSLATGVSIFLMISAARSQEQGAGSVYVQETLLPPAFLTAS